MHVELINRFTEVSFGNRLLISNENLSGLRYLVRLCLNTAHHDTGLAVAENVR